MSNYVEMADPLTIVGTVASVGAIIELLSKSISTIRELQAQWQVADLATLSLGSQMGVLKAALTKIQEWIETGPSEAHHQLIMDLDSSLLCCKTLVGKIDAQLSALQQKSDGSLGMASRIKLVLTSHDIEGIQKMIERQTNTLTLPLTACNRWDPVHQVYT
ncbi:hypothetical protein BKA64DRAFT_652786 [Cadophora sp. MPI-SDFR-AT-0126]|nr:hypothetical protein BKA64DRAFT_652786 [Leotiomycetes sp. MPI-SDFR-AT-0126]